MVAFYDVITSSIEEGRAENVVYFDFSNVFDTISHNIFVTKFGKCGIENWMVRWIGNWLTELRI